jgi:hypothetical protein
VPEPTLWLAEPQPTEERSDEVPEPTLWLAEPQPTEEA